MNFVSIFLFYNNRLMEENNETSGGDFILLGFSDQPQLEAILFVVILISYLLTILGNTAIILVSWLDSKLHTPMYFFLTNLSFLDLLTTSIVPQLLWNLKGPAKTIASTGCAIQLYLSLSLGSTECVLLTIMTIWPLCSGLQTSQLHQCYAPTIL